MKTCYIKVLCKNKYNLEDIKTKRYLNYEKDTKVSFAEIYNLMKYNLNKQ